MADTIDFNRPFLTVKEFAEEYQLHEVTVYKHLKTGKIKGFRVGGAWRLVNPDTLSLEKNGYDS